MLCGKVIGQETGANKGRVKGSWEIKGRTGLLM